MRTTTMIRLRDDESWNELSNDRQMRLLRLALIQHDDMLADPARIGTMQKPTADEVTRYARKKGFVLDGGEFVAFYKSKGWKVGKNPMKSWKGAVDTWCRKRRSDGSYVHRRIHIGDDEKPKFSASYIDF